MKVLVMMSGHPSFGSSGVLRADRIGIAQRHQGVLDRYDLELARRQAPHPQECDRIDEDERQRRVGIGRTRGAVADREHGRVLGPRPLGAARRMLIAKMVGIVIETIGVSRCV
jgi:hypothetical protein